MTGVQNMGNSYGHQGAFPTASEGTCQGQMAAGQSETTQNQEETGGKGKKKKKKSKKAKKAEEAALQAGLQQQPQLQQQNQQANGKVQFYISIYLLYKNSWPKNHTELLKTEKYQIFTVSYMSNCI